MKPGDKSAFEQLMRRYNRTLFRTARAILRDDAQAEEAVQDAYLRAYQALADFRGAAKLSTWLVRIAVSEALARRRKQRRGDGYPPVRADSSWTTTPSIGSTDASHGARSIMRCASE